MTNSETTFKNLTALESEVLIKLISELYAEPGYSDISPQDLSSWTKIKMNSLRGVLGSLTKKGVIFIIDKEDLGSTADIVYLREDFYFLHPEWKDC